ncbi:MAG: DUF1343 domain-containing protein, partial [Anaerolineae bacterium]
FYGIYSQKDCHGVKIMITDTKAYRPLSVQYLLIGLLKSLYPKEIGAQLAGIEKSREQSFCKINGNDAMLNYLLNDRYIAWKLIQYDEAERKVFLQKREKYLLY